MEILDLDFSAALLTENTVYFDGEPAHTTRVQINVKNKMKERTTAIYNGSAYQQCIRYV